MLLYNVSEVESIKIAVHNVESRGLRSKEILLGSITWLRMYYEKTREKRYLEKAVSHIYAYLELGYPYDYGRSEFEGIVDFLQVELEDIFPARKWQNKKIILNKGNVRNLLGRWNPSLHCMKISEVVEDIMNKANRKVIGEYLYHSGKMLISEGEEMLWEHTFRLYVREDEVILHDLNGKKYYVLEQQ